MQKGIRPLGGREQRTHIGVYGRTNAGKSTLVNLLAGGEVSIVSPEAGTTTDPVRKSVEMGELGPCVLVDTAGFGDASSLGGERMRRSLATMHEVDMALIVLGAQPWGEVEEELATRLTRAGTPYLVVRAGECRAAELIPQLLELKGKGKKREPRGLFDGLLARGDIVLLITPIDSAAPKGRMILPQVQAIRAAIDLGAIPIVCKPEEIEIALRSLSAQPRLAVTDSQVFAEAGLLIPPDIPYTSFSMLLARQKGDYDAYRAGIPAIDRLRPGDRVLVMEGCTHQSTCEDIGRVKIPRWLMQRVGGDLQFDFVNGVGGLPISLGDYALALLCGGCMLTPRQIRGRVQALQEVGVPVVNYGMAIAYLQGIYERASEPLA